MTTITIGTLAVQGAFLEHNQTLRALGCRVVELRQKSDLHGLDGIVLPGGESTVQRRLLRLLDMQEPLKELIRAGTPVLGTCAGLILLADKISNDPDVGLATLPVEVERNAYGRQLGSFQRRAPFDGLGLFDMTFIRAPVVLKTAPGVKTLAEVDGKIVAVEYRNQLGLTFHPELGSDTRIHQRFVDMARAFKNGARV